MKEREKKVIPSFGIWNVKDSSLKRLLLRKTAISSARAGSQEIVLRHDDLLVGAVQTPEDRAMAQHLVQTLDLDGDRVLAGRDLSEALGHLRAIARDLLVIIRRHPGVEDHHR